MAFTSISSLAIAVGAAIKKELWDLVKNNMDDHETRLNLVETSAQKVDVFDLDFTNSNVFSTGTGMIYFRAKSSFTLTNAFATIFEVGSNTGFFEFDIKKSTTDLDDTSFASIFTTKPKITFATANDYDETTNQVFDAGEIDIVDGDYLRLDITQMPSTGVMSKFLITAYGE